MRKLLAILLLAIFLFPSCNYLRQNTEEIIDAETELLDEGIELDEDTHWYIEIDGEVEFGVTIDL